MPDTGPKARSIPAWGNAPCHRHKQTMSANGAAHPSGIVWAGVNGAWRWDGTDFQPLGCLRSDTWANGPGSWPDELPRAESPPHYFGRSCSCHVDLPRQQTRQQQVARPAEVVKSEIGLRNSRKHRRDGFLEAAQHSIWRQRERHFGK